MSFVLETIIPVGGVGVGVAVIRVGVTVGVIVGVGVGIAMEMDRAGDQPVVGIIFGFVDEFGGTCAPLFRGVAVFSH